MEPSATKNQFRYVALALLIGTFAAFSSVLRADFINYDDLDYVVNNYHLKSGLTAANISWAFTTGFASNWHPLTWISLMVDYQLYGLRAGGFHLTNLLLHMANSVLLLAVVYRMTGALWRSAFVAALFAWHPLHVESVTWVAERKDVLSGFFWLLTMLFYVRYAREFKVPGSKFKVHYVLALVFFVCALMSKPMAVTLPFVLLLMDWWPLKRVYDFRFTNDEPQGTQTNPARATPGKLAVEKLPFFALAAASSIITFSVQKAGHAVALLENIPWSERIANALVAYASYLRKTVWPDDLAIFYPFQHQLPAWQWLGAALLLAALTGLAVATAKKRSYFAVGWFWYLGTLVPVIGLVQVGEQSLADRYTYLPLIGVFIILAWGIADLTQPWPGRIIILKVAAAGVLAGCLLLTAIQTRYWRDSITLFTHDLAVAKDNSVAHANIADALDKQNKVAEAKAEFMKALKLDPESPRTLNGLGELYAQDGDVTNAVNYFNAALRRRPLYSDAHYNFGNLLAAHGKFTEAADHYILSLREKPGSAEAHNNLGVMCLHLGKPDEAADEFQAALNIQPDFPEAHVQMGDVLSDLQQPVPAQAHYAEAVQQKPDFAYAHLRLGLGLAQDGDVEDAVAQLLTVTKLDPTNATAYNDLGRIFIAQKNFDSAAEVFAKAVQLDPANADFQARLATTLAYQRKIAEAVKVYQDALRLKPDLPIALRNLAWILATDSKPEIRNGAEAVKLAEHANALIPKPDPSYLEVLDAAYAEAGRFDDAIKTAEKVQQLCTNEQQKVIADRAAKRLELYKAGKPFHETSP